MKKIRVIYFTFEGLFSNAFESQVLNLINGLINLDKSKFNFILVVFSPFSHLLKRHYWSRRSKVKKILRSNCLFSYRFPFLFRFPKLINLSIFINSLICFSALICILGSKKREKMIFHCRGQIAGYILLKLKDIFYKNAVVFSDIRSIASVEALNYYYIKRNRVRLARRLREIENFIEKKSDYISCVSETFKNYILNKNEKRISNVEVIPNCIDINKFFYNPYKRKLSRKKMRIEDKFVVVYSGSLQEGKQLPERMIDIYRIIKNVIGSSVFLVLTNNKEYAKELFNKSGLDQGDYIIFNKPYDILSDYLITGDIGLLVLSDNENSNVARPIKFAEYLRCGVPVLINSSLHDISKSISKYDCGFEVNNCLNDAEIVKTVSKIKKNLNYIRSSEYKCRISEIIGKEMGWTYYLENLLGIYNKLT